MDSVSVSNDVHVNLDAAVNRSRILANIRSKNQQLSILDASVLLSAIIQHSGNRFLLDTKYARIDDAFSLVDHNEYIYKALVEACREGSYRKVRELPILQRIPPELSPEYKLYDELAKSFKTKFHGPAVEGFCEYLTENERLFEKLTKPVYYAKFCSIVQSSGTGKTRMLTELHRKGVIVIYMNLREKGDKSGFPARDEIPSNILTEVAGGESAYQIVCTAFFAALFETLQWRLSEALENHKSEARADIMAWNREMCDMTYKQTKSRKDFFEQLSKKYKACTDAFYAGVFKWSWTEPAVAAYVKMAQLLEKIIPGNIGEPKLVIAIDEAHTLTKEREVRSGMSYRPANVLFRVINAYSHCLYHGKHAVWVVFVSKTSCATDFSPPNKEMSRSARRAPEIGEALFPPYTLLGWDQNAVRSGDISIQEVSQVRHIASYGRPLWISLKNARDDARGVIDIAFTKLCGAARFDPENLDHVLAVLGQRFALEFTLGHPEAVSHLEEGVASHLRICLSTTLDCRWGFTSYPSEPLLSYVAAGALHEDHEEPKILGNVLRKLLEVINAGMIEIGERGELANRLLWLLAKDLFIRSKPGWQKPVDRWTDHLVDCEMIPVMDWLVFVFGPKIWNFHDSESVLGKFKDARINFSHWIRMKENIRQPQGNDDMILDEMTASFWQKTSAVQCCHQQPLVDKMIPIYFDRGENNCDSAKSQMSQIFISDKVQESASSKNTTSLITREHESLGGENSGSAEGSTPLPYIVILNDLSWKKTPSSFEVTYPKGDGEKDPCLRIYAPGLDADTYPFLANHTELLEGLTELVNIEERHEMEQAAMKELDARFSFGSTSSASHMRWEQL